MLFKRTFSTLKKIPFKDLPVLFLISCFPVNQYKQINFLPGIIAMAYLSAL